MPAETSRTIQITLRVPKDWPTRADKLAPLLGRPGMDAGRADAMRAALARGFEVLEAELGVEAPAPTNGSKGKARRSRT